MSEKEINATGKCLGYDFVMTQWWRFRVPELDNEWDTYEKMKEGIERVVQVQAKAKRKVLDIDAMDEKGGLGKITGIHAGHGQVVTKPREFGSDGWRRRALYPPVEWIVQAIKRRKQIKADLPVVEAVLSRFRLRLPGESDFNPEKFHDHFEATEKECAAKLKAASKTTLEVQLKNTKPSEDEFD